MLRGELACLRARQEADVPVLHAELYEDVPTRVRADSRPWRPIAADSPASPYRPKDDDDLVAFSVVELASTDNTAMLGAACRSGFQREGTLRRSAWVNGEFADEVILGLLASEWRDG